MSVAKQITIYLMPWGRVGSNLVNSIMAQNRSVKVYNEPLTRIDMEGRKRNLPEAEIWDEQAAWLEENILTQAAPGPIFLNLAAVHIKNPRAFAQLFSEVEPVYIVHDRKDIVATVISAMRTQAWTQEAAEKGEKRSWAIPKGESVDFRPIIPVPDFLEMVGVVELGREIIETVTAGRNATKYFYEDLLFDMDGVITDVFSKACIPFHSYEVRSAKFGSEALENMVGNAGDLSDAIIENRLFTKLELTNRISDAA